MFPDVIECPGSTVTYDLELVAYMEAGWIPKCSTHCIGLGKLAVSNDDHFMLSES